MADADESTLIEETRFRLLVESVKDYAIFILDTDGRIASWNAGAERINGYRAAEIIGQHFSVFYPRAEIDSGKCERELVIAAEEGRVEEEGWRLRKDGSRLWANVTITALRKEDGTLIGYAKVTQDLTERKAAEEETRRFRLLVESVKDYAIFILNPEGRVATWNPGAERIKGYTASEIIGKHFSIFYPRSDVEGGKCELELEIAARDGRFEEEGWRVRKDGSRFWANVTITALRTESALVGFAKVTRDLTERKAAEEARVRLARMQEVERRNQEFLAIMGHELRNPLAPMVTAMHLIRLRGGRNCEHEIAVLSRQLTHMTRLVDDILDASRFIRDEVRLVRNVMEISEVLANAVDVAAPLLEQKRHQLDIHVPKSGGLLVNVDLARMTQVFGNIITNAAKYTDAGGKISITAAKTEESGGGDGADGANNNTMASVVVTIEDNGIGIAPDVLPRVFDLFTQAEQGIDRRQGGLGIGLAVARRLILEHGGEVVAESRGLGRGSRFIVRFPRVVGAAAAAAVEPAETPVAATRFRRTSHPRRVLVVDDNEDAAQMLCECLEELGHEVRMAFDGPEALAAATEFSPALVFLDIGLPGLSGYDVVERMRQIPSCATVPIVALTGYAAERDRERSLSAGFSAHMAKPLDVTHLDSLIDTMMSGQSTCRSLMK